MWGEGNSFTSACEHRCGEESVLHLSSLISWVSKQSLQIFTSFSLTIHITHVILAHVAFNGSFTNQVFVTFNEHYFTPGAGTICRTDVRYFSAAAASVWTADSEKKGVILLEEDIFLTPSDHQKAEDVRGVVGRKQLLYQIHWMEM